MPLDHDCNSMVSVFHSFTFNSFILRTVQICLQIFQTRSYYKVQDDLDCVIFLPLPPKSQNYKHEPPHWAILTF